jgi:hypothetical protein
MAAVYVLIGLGVLRVVDEQAGATSMLEFGLSAGALFLTGAVLLAWVDNRALWIVGAVLQVFVALMYIAVSGMRTPPFEVWGIGLRLLQVPLFVALVYLSLMPADPSRSRRARHADAAQASHT